MKSVLRARSRATSCCFHILLLAGFVLSAGLAQAATTYADQNGTSFAFTNLIEETNTAGDPDPIWGAPSVVGDSLLFTPSDFTSNATGGSVDQTQGTFEVDITSLDNTSIAIDQLLFTELGDYSLTGSGTSATQASVLAGAFVAVTEVNVGGVVQAPGALDLAALLGSDTEFLSFDTPAQGDDWDLSLNLDVQSMVDAVYGSGNAFATSVSVVWNNDLATTSESGTTSQIQKKIGVPSVTLEVIPEPGTALLMGLGLLGLASVRRR